MDTLPVVELRAVTKTFGDVTAVNNTTLQIHDGEFYSLLGPSGCGKTTILRLIAGLETPTRGEIYLNGQAMVNIPAFKRPVNTVFQSYALFPHMTVEQNVTFGLEMTKLPKSEIRQRVAETVEMVQLTGLTQRRPRQLSGGQQQRVALARALVNHPKVLLLDEPLAALDHKLRQAMQLELKKLQQRVGITFLYVTHDQEEALTMSDRIAILHKGHILQVGRPAEIYEQPASRFVADFIGETNFFDGVAESVENDLVKVRVGKQLLITARAVHKPGLGQSVCVAVRPERIKLSVADNAEGYTGEIVDSVYSGVDIRYHVQLWEGYRVIVKEQNSPDFNSRFYVGQRVSVHWHPSSALILLE